MAQLSEHPTVKRFQERVAAATVAEPPSNLDSGWLRQLCLETGADDVGFVEIGRPELADQREEILSFFPRTKTLISFVSRMNREPIRSTARSVANLEFHHSGDHVNETARRIVAALEERGIRAVNPAMGFPMEMSKMVGKLWVVSHKPVAVAAGLGHMGIHRNVIHPKFGDFILLGTVLTNRKGYLQEVVKPLQEKEETVYVVAGSDAEEHVARRFPNKKSKRVGNGLNRGRSIRGFLSGLPFVFQRGRAKGLEATYHFTFTGAENVRATIVNLFVVRG